MPLIHHIKDHLNSRGVPYLMTIAVLLSLNMHVSNNMMLMSIDSAVLLILLMVIGYFYSHYQKHISLPRNPSAFFYLAFVIWAGFSTLWSSAQATSLVTLMPFIGGLLTLILSFTYSAQQAKLQRQMLVLLALMLSLLTFYQAFILKINRPSGLFLDYNTHAAFLTMVLLPLCGQFLSRQKQHRHVILIGLCCMTLCIAINLTLCRGALASLLVGLMLISALALRVEIPMTSLLKLYALLIASFLLGEWLNHNESFTAHAIASADNLEKLGAGRHHIWKPAWQMFLDKPLFGWGFGTFYLLYFGYKAPLTAEAGNYAHNDYLQFLIELGPIGLLLFLGFALNLLLCLVKLFRETNLFEFSKTHFDSYALLATCLAMLVHSLVNFNLYQLPIQILLGFYTGRALNYLYANQSVFVPKQIMSSNRYYGIVSGFSIPALLFLGSLLLALTNANKAQTSSNADDKLDYAWKAQLFSPFFDNFDYQKTLQLTALLKKAGLSASDKQEISNTGIELIDQAIYKSGLNPFNYVAKAELLRAADTQNIHGIQIKRLYQRALSLTPDSLKIRDDFAVYLNEHQQGDQALALYWAAWGRYNAGLYQNGIIFLTHQLEVNHHFGTPEDNFKIEQEINKLLERQKKIAGGSFVFGKSTPL